MAAKNTVMTQWGTVNAGCGQFGYRISSTEVPLEAFNRHCFEAGEFGDHGDIERLGVSRVAGAACTASSIEPIKRRDESTFRHINRTFGKVRYEQKIYWKDNCSLKETDSVLPNNPLRVENPGKTCYETLMDNYKKCDNGGIGGRIQIGCLVYEFKGTKA